MKHQQMKESLVVLRKSASFSVYDIVTLYDAAQIVLNEPFAVEKAVKTKYFWSLWKDKVIAYSFPVCRSYIKSAPDIPARQPSRYIECSEKQTEKLKKSRHQ
jgi:hypothetical protein